MKKIMILMAERTGTGHKSAANALQKQFNNLGYNTEQIDSFTTMGKLGILLENSYIPITTKHPVLFYIPFLFTQVFPNLMHFLIYIKSKKKMKAEIQRYKPDLIISVHSMFTKSVSRLLKKQKLDIPFYIDVIDLVNPPNVWYDEGADMIFVPDNTIKESYIKKGFNQEKIIVSGFPIREDIERRKEAKKIDGKINILLVNPSVKLRKTIKYVQEVSKIENTEINVICGRDQRMYDALINRQNKGKISKDVKIYGFVNNMNEFLDKAHILLTKAGPNMILEGARSGTAIIITGHILGQENSNYEYVTNNEFGFKCENPNKIYKQLNEFIKTSKLEECLKNVLKAECNDGTKIIAKKCSETLDKK